MSRSLTRQAFNVCQTRPLNLTLKAMISSARDETLRETCGSSGKRVFSHEDGYFWKEGKEQLKYLRKHLNQEIAHHEGQIQQLKKVTEKVKDLVM